jgi:hypothetical protein
VPAAQLDVPQVEHGAKPVEDHVPAVQGGSATQASNVAFQAKPRLQAHLDWPEIMLLVLYSGVVPHGRQAVSPSKENKPATQGAHVAFEVAPKADEYVPAAQGVQLEAPSALAYVPAAQAVQFEAPAEDVEPAEQFAHSRSESAKQGIATYWPAAHVPGRVQAVQGAKPVAEKVLPATQAGGSTLIVTFAEADSELPAPELVACTTSE